LTSSLHDGEPCGIVILSLGPVSFIELAAEAQKLCSGAVLLVPFFLALLVSLVACVIGLVLPPKVFRGWWPPLAAALVVTAIDVIFQTLLVEPIACGICAAGKTIAACK